MRTHVFGPTGREVPVIGQGTWNSPTRSAPRDEAVRALRRGIELGMTHIDTAEMYGNGASEELVASAIEGFPREELFLVSKVLPSNGTYRQTIAACEATLKRMRIEYLDCYLLHWRGGEDLEETMHALEALVRNGKIRALGVSNFDVEDMQEARGYLDREKIACNQLLYNLHDRTIESAEIADARDHGTAVVGYTPFGRRASVRDDVVERIARERGVSPRAVILAFLVRDPIAFAIPKASTVAHVEENAQAGDLVLTDAETAAIDAAHTAGRRRGALPMN